VAPDREHAPAQPDLPTYVGPGPTTRSACARSTSAFQEPTGSTGTNDIRKIGRQSSNGCIGLFNEHIVEVYDRARSGTPVLLI
jgi:hypothetical protein